MNRPDAPIVRAIKANPGRIATLGDIAELDAANIPRDIVYIGRAVISRARWILYEAHKENLLRVNTRMR